MPNDDKQSYIPTRDAAVVLGVTHNRAFAILSEHACEKREVTPRQTEWRRADVDAIRELRESGALNVRIRSTGPSGNDYCGCDGALRLKERIEAYWRERGGVVTVELIDAGFVPAMRSTRVDVRSDMVNGFPREWSEKP